MNFIFLSLFKKINTNNVFDFIFNKISWSNQLKKYIFKYVLNSYVLVSKNKTSFSLTNKLKIKTGNMQTRDDDKILMF